MLAALKEIVNPDVVLNIATGDRVLILKEDAPDSKIKKLYIKDVPENSFTLDLQPGGAQNRWFQQLSCYVDIGNERGVNKGCDLVLLVPQCESQWVVLIFDLKSDKPRKGDTEKQLLNSELYVQYLMTMVRHHYGIDTSTIRFQRSIVTTNKHSVRQSSTYRPNQKKPERASYNTESVRVVGNKEAYINLGALLR